MSPEITDTVVPCSVWNAAWRHDHPRQPNRCQCLQTGGRCQPIPSVTELVTHLILSSSAVPYLGSAHRVFILYVLRYCASSIFTCFSFMSFLIPSLHLSFGLPIHLPNTSPTSMYPPTHLSGTIVFKMPDTCLQQNVPMGSAFMISPCTHLDTVNLGSMK